nr:MAG TPA: hypothetical protein [Microviridae sp.]
MLVILLAVNKYYYLLLRIHSLGLVAHRGV